jgi:hypothetical protein
MANAVVKSIANEGLDFFNELQSQQQTFWGENQQALTALSKAWAPVLSSGIVPYGYSPGLDSLLQSNVIQTAGQATTNAENAAALQQKQATGGADVAPTGANEAINAEILAKGQQSEASGLQQEKIAGYQQGLANLEGATNAEQGIIEATNPEKAAEAATGTGNLAETAGNAEFEENQQTGPLATFQGVSSGLANLGKAASGFAGAFHKGGKIKGKKDREVLILAKEGEVVIPKRGDVSAKRRRALISQALAKD